MYESLKETKKKQWTAHTEQTLDKGGVCDHQNAMIPLGAGTCELVLPWKRRGKHQEGAGNSDYTLGCVVT